MLASNPQNPDPSTCKDIFRCQNISAFVITVADTFPVPVTVVTFYCKHIQHGGEGYICPDQRRRTFFQITGKDIAMMKIYRYHGYDVLRRNERGRIGSSN